MTGKYIATVAGAVAVAAYARVAHAGRIFPFAPVATHEDPEGALANPAYKPVYDIALYCRPPCTLRSHAGREMDYLHEYSRQHFRDRKNTKPLRLTMWPTAVAYYADRVVGGDRRCLEVTGKHVGGRYLETVVEDRI